MPITKIDKNGNEIYLTDPNGNEIGMEGKVIGGILFVAVTLMAVLLIIAHWPDKMPPLGKSDVCTKYQYKWFDIKYLGKQGENPDARTFIVIKKDAAVTTEEKKQKPKVDEVADSTLDEQTDTLIVQGESGVKPTDQIASKYESDSLNDNCGSAIISIKKITKTIDINTLILLLVALSGFLGNMIHITSSFTNFVGGGKFKRSWLLWYIVKPFTAAALAVGVYIIFRAGFLNSVEATASLNLYGVVAIAILAGLFTDMATLKLKEVFGVVFNTSTVRANPLDLPKLKITGVNPKELPLNIETTIVVNGSGFDNRVLKVEIDKQEIKEIEVQPNSIAFKYTATTTKPGLIIYDEKGVELLKYDLITAEPASSTVVTITDIAPVNLTVNTATEITIAGTALDTAILTIKIGDATIAETDITKASTSLKFSYTPLIADDIVITVKDDKDAELLNKTLTVV